MGATTIEWTDYSHNPIGARLRPGVPKGEKVRGIGHYCEKISPGCANCYASQFQPRFGMPPFPGARPQLSVVHYPDAVPVSDKVEVFLDYDALEEMLHWRRPRRVFLCDMTDLFGGWVPFDWIDRVFAHMALTPHVTYQILTKRPDRMAEYFNAEIPLSTRAEMVADFHPRKLNGKAFTWGETNPNDRRVDPYERRKWPGWPLRNVWLGTSVENQKFADLRVPELVKCPAAVHFLSVEPLLGPIDLGRSLALANYAQAIRHTVLGEDLHSLDWAIVGGESGPGARPMHPAWVRTIRDQCMALSVPFFFKQWGAWLPINQIENSDRLYESIRKAKPGEFQGDTDEVHGKRCKVPTKIVRHDGKVFDAGQEGAFQGVDGHPSMQVFKLGKKRAGRLLDGREWNEMPRAREGVAA